jgi:hypothetical protein
MNWVMPQRYRSRESLANLKIYGLGRDPIFFLGQLIRHDHLQHIVARRRLPELYAAHSDQMLWILLILAIHSRRRSGINLLSIAE